MEYFRNEKPFQAQLSVEPTLSWLFTSCLKRKLRCWWHICYSWSSICQARIQFTSSLTSFKARPSTTNIINFGLSWVLVESDLKKLYSMYLHNIWRNELFRMVQIICSTRLKAHHLRPHLDLNLEPRDLKTMEKIWSAFVSGKKSIQCKLRSMNWKNLQLFRHRQCIKSATITIISISNIKKIYTVIIFLAKPIAFKNHIFTC